MRNNETKMMKRKFMKLQTFLLWICAGVLIFSISGCSEEDPSSSQTTQKDQLSYELFIPVTSKEEKLLLTGYRSPLRITLSDPGWLYCTTPENDLQNDVATVIFRLADDVENTSISQIVTIADADGKRCDVKVSVAMLAVMDNDGDDEAFLKDWENQEAVAIYPNDTVATPWNKSYVISTLPKEIRQDVKKEDGWEMVFSTLNNERLKGANYFGLYNKYSGVLRIFFYVTDSNTDASQYCLEVNLGSKKNSNKFPFYNSLNFGIPSSHTKIDTEMDLLGLGVKTTFKTFITPSTDASTTDLKKGWTAFDIDASAFCPPANDWNQRPDELSFAFKSTTESLITLCGSLTGDIEGSFSEKQETSASATSGVGKTLRQLGTYTSKGGNPINAMTKMLFGKDISGAVNAISGVLNFTASIADFFADSTEEEQADNMTGKVELSLSGQLQLSGKITSVTGNSCPPLTISSSTFAESHFGQGIWGLTDDPVVYMVSDVVMGDASALNLIAKGNGKFQLPKDAAVLANVRMVTFLDPTNIKLAVSDYISQGIEEIEVVGANIVVYPDAEAGFTGPYRALLNLPTPSLKLTSQSSGIWRTEPWKNAKDCGYAQIPCHTLRSALLGETADNCKVYAQKGAEYKYYGKVDKSLGKTIIVDPQIMLPISVTDKGTFIMPGVIPDIAVAVTVRFKADNRYFMFSRRFIPKIQQVSIKNGDLAKVKTRLQDYNDKCKSKSVIQTLNGKSIRHTTGESGVERPLIILNKLLGK